MRHRYRAFKEVCWSAVLGSYDTCGIVWEGEPDEVIHDVSTDWELVQRLAEACSRAQLDPVHLMDVVQDAVAEGRSPDF